MGGWRASGRAGTCRRRGELQRDPWPAGQRAVANLGREQAAAERPVRRAPARAHGRRASVPTSQLLYPRGAAFHGGGGKFACPVHSNLHPSTRVDRGNFVVQQHSRFLSQFGHKKDKSDSFACYGDLALELACRGMVEWQQHELAQRDEALTSAAGGVQGQWGRALVWRR
ncbi:unnamed protein product [Urochloa humidicola]